MGRLKVVAAEAFFLKLKPKWCCSYTNLWFDIAYAISDDLDVFQEAGGTPTFLPICSR